MKTNYSSNSGLLNRTAQRSENNLPRIDMTRRHRNRAMPTEAVLNLLQQEAPRFWELALVVGKWVWIEFDARQPRHVTAILSQLGFHWNKRRQLWQHPCGTFTDSTPKEPRETYLTYYPADVIWR